MQPTTASFYNEISKQYNEIMDQKSYNAEIRNHVAAYFKKHVKGDVVLDFGGGTGLDLPWLSELFQTVYFCEPSEGMRQKAIDFTKLHSLERKIHILYNQQVDFKTWTLTLPFEEKVDGLLANFAVINCIEDIHALYASLALVMKSGAHFVALILDNSWKTLLNSHTKNTLSSLFSGKAIVTYANFNEHQHTAYIHSNKAIKAAAAPYFTLHKQQFMGGFGFSLIHLIRK